MMEELHSIVSLGGGGVTKLVNPATGRIDRMANPKYPYEYITCTEKVLRDKETAVRQIALQMKEATLCPTV